MVPSLVELRRACAQRSDAGDGGPAGVQRRGDSAHWARLRLDPALAKVVVQHNAGLILNHMRGRPETWGKLPPVSDVMGMIVKELERTTAEPYRRSGPSSE